MLACGGLWAAGDGSSAERAVVGKRVSPGREKAAVRSWLEGVGWETIFITPGSLWENPCVESFLGKL